MSKANRQPNDIDRVRVMLWADPDQPGIYWDQPPDAGEGYRKPKKYSEADKKRLEKNIGEAVQVIRPGVKVGSNTADNSGSDRG